MQTFRLPRLRRDSLSVKEQSLIGLKPGRWPLSSAHREAVTLCGRRSWAGCTNRRHNHLCDSVLTFKLENRLMSEIARLRDTLQAHTRILMLLQVQAEQTTKGITTIIGLLTPPDNDEGNRLAKALEALAESIAVQTQATVEMQSVVQALVSKMEVTA
ncbi:hypothetical protein HK27_02200 [Acetobacter orientalis]|nr:hypothetical protein HK27_02200 [Acetobacter orientalis]